MKKRPEMGGAADEAVAQLVDASLPTARRSAAKNWALGICKRTFI